MQSFVATVEDGVIRVDEGHPLPNGRRVLVIALPASEGAPAVAPPQELLDEDAREFRPKRELIEEINEKALR